MSRQGRDVGVNPRGLRGDELGENVPDGRGHAVEQQAENDADGDPEDQVAEGSQGVLAVARALTERRADVEVRPTNVGVDDLTRCCGGSHLRTPCLERALRGSAQSLADVLERGLAVLHGVDLEGDVVDAVQNPGRDGDTLLRVLLVVRLDGLRVLRGLDRDDDHVPRGGGEVDAGGVRAELGDVLGGRVAGRLEHCVGHLVGRVRLLGDTARAEWRGCAGRGATALAAVTTSVLRAASSCENEEASAQCDRAPARPRGKTRTSRHDGWTFPVLD